MRFPDEPDADRRLSPRHGRSIPARRCSSTMSRHTTPRMARRNGSIQGEPARAVLFAPLIVGDSVCGRHLAPEPGSRRTRSARRDLRLLTTLAVEPERRARERAAVRRDAAPSDRNQRASSRAGHHQQRPGGPRRQSSTCKPMYDLVGDKIQEIFDAQVVDIGIYDYEAPVLSSRTPSRVACEAVRTSRRRSSNSRALRRARDRASRLSSSTTSRFERRDPATRSVTVGEPAKSLVFAPLDHRRRCPIGRISLQNLDRDRRIQRSRTCELLATLAASLTRGPRERAAHRRDAAAAHETNERAAELAIINSVQQGLAAELDMQAMYDLVGDKIREIFDAQVVDIGLYDFDRRADPASRTRIERGVRYPGRAVAVRRPDPSACIAAKRAARHRRRRAPGRARRGCHDAPSRASRRSRCSSCPSLSAARRSAASRSRTSTGQHAFSEADVGCSTRSPPASAWRSRTLAWSTRRASARRSWPSSTTSARRLAAQLDLDTLIELPGRSDEVPPSRPTSSTSRCSTGRRASSSSRLLQRERQAERRSAAIVGEGFTSRILETAQASAPQPGSALRGLGTRASGRRRAPSSACRSSLGDDAIGVVSVQSTREEGRFGETDERLLATLARQHRRRPSRTRRLYRESQRRASEMSALAEVGREISATLDLNALLERMVDRALTILLAGHRARSSWPMTMAWTSRGRSWPRARSPERSCRYHRSRRRHHRRPRRSGATPR